MRARLSDSSIGWLRSRRTAGVVLGALVVALVLGGAGVASAGTVGGSTTRAVHVLPARGGQAAPVRIPALIPSGSNYKVVTDSTWLGPWESRGRDVYCARPGDDSGFVPVGGGFLTSADLFFQATESFPIGPTADGFAGWSVFGHNQSPSWNQLTTYVICLKAA